MSLTTINRHQRLIAFRKFRKTAADPNIEHMKNKMELVFATHNQHKMEEIKALVPSTIRLLSLNDIGCFQEIPETAVTIDGNATQKAEFVKNKLGYDCFADDTGLEVKAVKGAPGVYSARYAGDAKNPEANIDNLLKEMEGVQDRTARFKTVIALN